MKTKKIAIISDIHSNLEALESVYEDIKKNKCQEIYCLGDIVGYGPQPKECVELATNICNKIIRGNHESCVHDYILTHDLNPIARAGISFSKDHLSSQTINMLGELPKKLICDDIDICLCHGAYSEPSDWKYIIDEIDAKIEVVKTPTKICVVGHTHYPFIFGNKKGIHHTMGNNIIIQKSQKYIINVGSVGQPRDGDRRASYGIFTFGKQTSFKLQRVNYDIKKTVDLIIKVGLPSFIATRLLEGE